MNDGFVYLFSEIILVKKEKINCKKQLTGQLSERNVLTDENELRKISTSILNLHMLVKAENPQKVINIFFFLQNLFLGIILTKRNIHILTCLPGPKQRGKDLQNGEIVYRFAVRTN